MRSLFLWGEIYGFKMPLTDLARKLEMTISGFGYSAQM